MNKLLMVALTLATSITFAQKDFQGMAVYESKTSSNDFTKRIDENKDLTPEMKASIKERMKKVMEKTFVLTFDKSKSTYKEEEKLDAPGQNGGGARMMSNMMGIGGSFYKDVKEGTFTVDREFFGKSFLVQDTLTKYKWVMTEETKQIGDYTCFKATAVVPVSKYDFKNMRLRDTKKEEEKTKQSEPKKEKTTNFMDELEVPKTITLTAWYCPEIPINNGPDSYWGLPGLIMEVNDGRTIMLCSKIVLNVKEKSEIKPPTAGTKVTQSEYDEIVMKKMKEMSETMNGGNGRGGMQMRMSR